MADPKPLAHSDETPSAPWSAIEAGPFRRRATICKAVGLSLFLGLAAYLLRQLFGQLHWDLTQLLRLCAAVTVLGVAGTVLLAGAESLEDNAREAGILNGLRRTLDSEQKFCLLLRSFNSTLLSETTYRIVQRERDQLRMVRGEPTPTGRTYQVSERTDERTDEVVVFLSNLLRRAHLLVIDGEARDLILDPLRILSRDEEWWTVFESLAEKAQLVIVVPEASRSLTREIASMREARLLSSCLFLMPPSRARSDGDGEGALSGATRRERWTESRSALPLALPDYDEAGALLVFDERGALAERLPYAAASFDRVLDARADRGVPLREALGALRAKGLLDQTLGELVQRAKRLGASVTN
jgi:hypothetical protein